MNAASPDKSGSGGYSLGERLAWVVVALSMLLPSIMCLFGWPEDRFWLHWEILAVSITVLYMLGVAAHWFLWPPRMVEIVPGQATLWIVLALVLGSVLLGFGLVAACRHWDPRLHMVFLATGSAMMLLGTYGFSAIRIETSGNAVIVKVGKWELHNPYDPDVARRNERMRMVKNAKSLVQSTNIVWYFGDLPTVLGFVGLAVYVIILYETSVPVSEQVESLIGGAVSFQLLFSNVVYAVHFRVSDQRVRPFRPRKTM